MSQMRHREGDQPRLFSFLTEEALGVEAFFLNEKLCVAIKNRNRTDQPVTFKFPFEPKSWYFIVISHQYHMMRKSEVTLFVNGNPSETLYITYPKFDAPVSCSHVGTNGEALEPLFGTKAMAFAKDRSQPLFGQMGPILMLSDAYLTQPDVKRIYEMGPNMESRNLVDSGEIACGVNGNQFYVDKRFIGRIVFFYTPKATDGMLCTEVSDLLCATRSDATMMEGVKIWNTRSIFDSIQSFGGVSVIFADFFLTILRILFLYLEFLMKKMGNTLNNNFNKILDKSLLFC